MGFARTEVHWHGEGDGQHRVSVFPVGGSVRYPRTGEGYGHRHRHYRRFADHVRSEDGEVHGVPVTLSDAVLHARNGWTHRRFPGGMERPRHLGYVQFLYAEVHGNEAR